LRQQKSNPPISFPQKKIAPVTNDRDGEVPCPLFSKLQAGMFSRAVLDTSRTRVRTFGSDDAGHLVWALTRQVTLDDPGLAPVVGVIAPQL
jgi:hypothetical protein